MADYNDLIDSITAVIKTNNRREITGLILQNVLTQMVGSLGEYYQLAGMASPTTNPHDPDQNVFYIATEAGTYPYFDNLTLDDGLSLLMWKNEQWQSQTMGIATQQYVDDNYVSKAFLRQLFRPLDDEGDEILANDTESVVDSIQAMVGLWTESYLSALGLGSDGGGMVRTLAQLEDVELTTPIADGDVLTYDATNHVWVNAAGGQGQGTVTQIKVGNVAYDPVAGVVSLPAYPSVPTNVSSFTNDAGYIDGITSSMVTQALGYTPANSASLGNYLPLAGGTMTGNILSANYELRMNNGTNPYLALITSNNVRWHVQIYNDTMYLGQNLNGINIDASGNVSMRNGTRLQQPSETGAVLYIGTSDNYGWVRVQDMCSQSGSVGDSIWSIRQNGDAHFLNCYSGGDLSALSDARYKNVIGDVPLTIEQIAAMPAVLFTWNDRDDDNVYVGTLAQAWQGVLPQAVREHNDKLTFGYGNAALVGLIVLAKRVVELETIVKKLGYVA